MLFGRQGLSARNSGENWASGVEIREWEWGQADIAWAHYSAGKTGEVRGSGQRV